MDYIDNHHQTSPDSLEDSQEDDDIVEDPEEDGRWRIDEDSYRGENAPAVRCPRQTPMRVREKW